MAPFVGHPPGLVKGQVLMGNVAVRWSLSTPVLSLILPFSSFYRDILDDEISDQKCL